MVQNMVVSSVKKKQGRMIRIVGGKEFEKNFKGIQENNETDI